MSAGYFDSRHKVICQVMRHFQGMPLQKRPVNPEVLNVWSAVMASQLIVRGHRNAGEDTDSRGQLQIGRKYGCLPERGWV
jgi:hypothetical protein